METVSAVRLYLLNSLRFETKSEIRNINGIYGQLLGQIALGKIDQGAISRRELAGRLYPDVTDDRAKRLLSGALYRLKRDLGPFAKSLVTDIEYVTLDNVWIDTLEFYKKIKSNDPIIKKDAVELYSGELLPNLDHPSVLIHRHRLHEAYLQAIPEVIQHLEAADNMNEALLIAHRWTLNEPYDENAHITTIQLYLNLSREAAALKLYNQYAQRLEVELGIRPSDEVEALVNQIRMARPVEKKIKSKRFVGRQAEREQMLQFITGLTHGSGQAIFLKGAGGIGKTTYLHEIASLAEWRDIKHSLTVADEHDNRQFSPIGELIDQTIDRETFAQLKEQLPDITQQVLSNILASFKQKKVSGFDGGYVSTHVSLPNLKVALYQLL
ncbi:MAG: BTAD domain-containing putative transcriptional regulator, partial [Chloroflexota bacterium]